MKRVGKKQAKNRRIGSNVSTLQAHLDRQKGRRRFLHYLRVTFLTIGLIAVNGAGLYICGQWISRKLLFENSRYTLVYVDVEVTGKLRRDQVLTWADIPAEANVMALDLSQIQHSLELQSAIATAEVQRHLPNRLAIRVTERRPLARLFTDIMVGDQTEPYYLIDREGIVMRPRPGEDFRHLPEIRGVRLTDVNLGKRISSSEVYSALYLLELIEMSPVKAEFPFISVDVSGEDLLKLATKERGEVRFTTDCEKMGTQLARFQKIIGYCNESGKRLKTADMTVSRNVPVTFLPPES